MQCGVVRKAARSATAGLLAIALVACSQTTRVGEDTTTDALSKSKKGVAIMRLGMAGTTCDHVGIWLGVAEGRGFRPHTPVAVMNVRSLADPPIAEVELPPGEYHIISYACGNAGGSKQIAAFDKTTGLVRRSYASFTVAAGEIVNVGKFNFHASRVSLNAFGRPYRITTTVTDWPLDELEQYKQKRPALYAQMRTRLMQVTPHGSQDPDDDDCALLAALRAEGKVQNLPESCAAAAQPAPAKAPTRAATR